MAYETKPTVCLVRPQNLYNLQNYPPLGLVQLGSVLERAGLGVEILIGDGTDGFAAALAERARHALFVGITATTAEIPDAIALARTLRTRCGPGLPLVWGGWHPTLFPEQMRASDLVDFAVLGDGEDGLRRIAAWLRTGQGERPGKALRTGFVDVEALPPPDYALIPDLERFVSRPLNDKFQEFLGTPLRWLPYQSSRGCPYSCAFCINPTTGNRKYRSKSPAKTARELASMVQAHGLTHVKIIDDNFFVQRERVRDIFKEVEKLGVRFTWDAECRIDYFRPGFMDDAMLALLARNGLVQLTFGIESGSRDTLARMRKGLKAGPEYAVRAVALCDRHGVTARGSFILDIPGDTPRDIMDTVALIRTLRRYPRFSCGVHTYRPYPKSPLCEALLAAGKFYQPQTLEDWSDEAAVRQFTDTAATRAWQANHRLSSRVSFYESLESGFWLKPHQLPDPLQRAVNRLFMAAARFRNERRFYGFPADKALYLPFKDYCLRRQARKHRAQAGQGRA